MSLSDAQRGELNLAVHEYLLASGYPSAAASLAVEVSPQLAPHSHPTPIVTL